MQVVGSQAVQAAATPWNSFVLFSSTSAVWSQTGAAHYAAANSFLDALAAGQQHMGQPATSLQLGPFAGTGMAARHIEELAALGLRGLQPAQLHEAALIAGTAPQVLFARLDAARFAQLYTAKGRWSLLDNTLMVPMQDAPQRTMQISTSMPGNDSSEKPSVVPSQPGMTLSEVQEVIRKAAQDILGTTDADFDDFPSGGFDSLSAVELSSTVGNTLQMQLPGTLVYDYPSVSSMASHIHSLLAPKQVQNSNTSGALVPAPQPSLAAWLPGTHAVQVTAAHRFAQPSVSADAISIVPYDRWDLEAPRVRTIISAKTRVAEP